MNNLRRMFPTRRRRDEAAPAIDASTAITLTPQESQSSGMAPEVDVSALLRSLAVRPVDEPAQPADPVVGSFQQFANGNPVDRSGVSLAPDEPQRGDTVGTVGDPLMYGLPVAGTPQKPSDNRMPDPAGALLPPAPASTPTAGNLTVQTQTPRSRNYEGVDITIDPSQVQNKFVNPKYLPKPTTPDEYRERIEATENYQPKRQPSFWKRLGSGLLQGLAAWSQSGAPGGLYGLIGALGAGGTAFAASPGLAAETGKQQDLQRLWAGYGRAQQVEAAEQQARLREAQIADIPLEREQRLEQIRSTERRTALGQLNRLNYYDPNNPAHVRLAQTAGVDPATLKGWDFTKPATKTVAGVTYQFDRESGAFKPSNIPPDQSKSVIPYELTDMDGRKQTFWVTQTDAARFETQAKALGMQIEARKLESEADRKFRNADREDRQAAEVLMENIRTKNELLKIEKNAEKRSELQKQIQADRIELEKIRERL